MPITNLLFFKILFYKKYTFTIYTTVYAVTQLREQERLSPSDKDLTSQKKYQIDFNIY